MRHINSKNAIAFIAGLVAAFALTSPTSAQEPADATAAAQNASSQTVVASTVYASRVLSMPAQIHAAIVAAAKTANSDQPEQETTGSDDEDRQTAMGAGTMALFDDSSLTNAESGSFDSNADDALSELDGSNEENGEAGLGLVSSGRHGGEVREKGLGINVETRRGQSAHANLGARTEGETVNQIIRSHSQEAFRCYQKELSSTPGLSGKVEVMFMIDKTGNVMAPVVKSSTLGNDAVESCITKKMKEWVFPAPVSGQRTKWTFPFRFTADAASSAE